MAVLNSRFQKVAQNIIKIFDDVVEHVDYVRMDGIGAYDITTDAYVGQTETTFTNVRAVPIRPRNDQDDWQHIEDDSLKFIIAHLDLGFKPKINDHIIRDGVTYEIQQVKHIPSQAIYKISLRAP